MSTGMPQGIWLQKFGYGAQVLPPSSYRLACDCFSTPPTMPTCRADHLDWCTAVKHGAAHEPDLKQRGGTS